MTDEQQMLLCEYNTLRSEIIENQKAQNSLFTFAFTILSTIFGAALTTGNPYLFLVSFVVLIPVRCRHLFFQEMTLKVSTYIQINIESKIKDLSWESLCHQESIDNYEYYKRTHVSVKNEPKTRHVFILSDLQYYTFSIISCATTIIFFVCAYTQGIAWQRLTILTVISVILTLIVFRIDYYMLNKLVYVKQVYMKLWLEQHLNEQKPGDA